MITAPVMKELYVPDRLQPTQVFYCEFSQVFQNSCFLEYLWMAGFQQIFTYSKAIIKMLEKDVKYVQSVTIKTKEQYH